jgi:energy-coupling factor transport system ATP-binding protein
MNVLELKGVSYVYSKGTPFEKLALNNVSVSFEVGKVTGLIGRTGSGKSTLVNLLNGLNKPTSGEVLLSGVNIWDKPKEIDKIRFRVGLVMQYPEYQLFDETVREDIGFGPRNQGLSEADVECRVMEAARLTGLSEDILDKSPFELSGGQKRRVAIAGILASNPDILILDEVLSVGDGAFRKKSEAKIKEIINGGATTILVSHSLNQVRTMCNKILWLHKGKQIAFSSDVKKICDNYKAFLEGKKKV